MFRSRSALSIRSRLIFSFLSVIALLLVLAVGSLALVRGAYGELLAFQRDQEEINALALEMEAANVELANFLSSGTDSYLERSAAAIERFGALCRGLRGRIDLEFRFPLMDLERMAETYREQSLRLVFDYRAGMETIYVNRSRADLARLKGYIATDCGKLLASYLSRARERVAASRRAIERNENAAYLAALVVGIAAVLFALRTADKIAAPLHRLAGAATAFAGGNLSVAPVEYRGEDEIGGLVRSFNRMTAEIRDLINDVKGKAALEIRLHEQELRAAEAEASLRKTELELLQAQINPHFLFNALSAASALSRAEEAPNTRIAVESIAQIMRYTLASREGPSTVGKEWETVRSYLYLQGVRFGRRLSWSAEADADCLGAEIPPFSVQPFVENAVIHGIEPRERGGTVEVRARRGADGRIAITVKDDGAGMDERTLAEINAPGAETIRTHFGVGNVSRRLELIYGVPVVRVESESGAGTTVTIRLPPETA
jgi:HAMP domain-containing protein